MGYEDMRSVCLCQQQQHTARRSLHDMEGDKLQDGLVQSRALS